MTDTSTYIIQPGDHIYRLHEGYSHHGIYCGDITYNNRHYKDVVIHYDNKRKIKGLSFEKFARNQDVYYLLYKDEVCLKSETVVHRAINKLGETDYDLFWNNCEHFVHWCKTGKKISSQVNNYVEQATGYIIAGATAGLLPLSVPALGAMAIGGVVGYIGGALIKGIFMDSEDYKYD
ncbi:lecithin retinol acyltransferase family protein [Limnoraphis robusta]|uniref:lecithin retinol acyltransferase family protein n=1 Tax=Limnoraphis robusta TaxID=1118279 RepID=UPI00066EBF45|nr:lecithin retinol acyltransferase family protein [Limnoraphis robusta]